MYILAILKFLLCDFFEILALTVLKCLRFEHFNIFEFWPFKKIALLPFYHFWVLTVITFYCFDRSHILGLGLFLHFCSLTVFCIFGFWPFLHFNRFHIFWFWLFHTFWFWPFSHLLVLTGITFLQKGVVPTCIAKGLLLHTVAPK